MTNIIALAADHGGYALKEALKTELAATGHSVLDLGTSSTESVDYPDYAEKLVAALKRKEAHCGVLICGTGIGMSLAANRHKGIRAALVHDVTTARLAREHNDANVMCLGGRIIGAAVAMDCLAAFLNTPFAQGRHARRVAKIEDIG